MRFIVIVLLFGSAVAGFAFAAKFILRGNVEAEMEERAHAVLVEAGFEGVAVEFDHLSGHLGGYVESPEEKEKVVTLLEGAIPAASWPKADETEIAIRPTLQPQLRVTRLAGSDEVKIEGVLGIGDESSRALIGSRLHALPSAATVDNSITLDPTYLSFSKMAEFASLATGLLANPDEVEVSLRDNVVSMTGTVPNDGIKEGLLEIARKISDSDPVDEIEVKLPEALQRFSELKVTRNRFGITLTGVLNSKEERSAILSALREIAGVPQVIDRLQIDPGCARLVWQGKVAKILPLILSGLSGELTGEFSRSQVRLQGSATSDGARDAIFGEINALKSFDSDLEIIAEISVRNETDDSGGGFRMTAVYENGLLSLNGATPEEEFSEQLEERLAETMPGLKIKDELETIPETPGKEWGKTKVLEFLQEALQRVEAGTFTFSGDGLEMQGTTLALSDRQILQNIAVNTVPGGVSVINQLVHKDQAFPNPALLPEAATRLAEGLKQFSVYFDTSSDVLESDQKEKVVSIAGLVKDSGGPVELVVTGVSDSAGNAESNRLLSLRRANSVIQELVRLEIPEDSLTAGSSVENVSGRPRSERWKSRRVDVSLKPRSNPSEAAPPNP